MTSYLFVVHLAATLAMTGIIWFVQLVHYPLFASVSEEAFLDYEKLHARRTSWVVAPLMLAELISGLSLLVAGPLHDGIMEPMGTEVEGATWWFVVSLVMLGLLWVSTFFVQMPMHAKLSAGLDLSIVDKLTFTNWFRTLLWTARSAILLWLLTGSFTAHYGLMTSFR